MDKEVIIDIENPKDNDLISRQAVMDCFKKWQPYMATRLHEFEKELSELPSVDIPQDHDGCKDCKYETYPEYYYPCCECKQNYMDMWKAVSSAYKGMTNGKVIKMLYPQGEIVKGLYGISGNPLICVNLNISTECSEMVFTEDWWNSPYEPQESEDKE